MRKKQTKHFVPNKNDYRGGVPACHGFGRSTISGRFLSALGPPFEEVAKTRRGVTCGNCRRTRVFRKLK